MFQEALDDSQVAGVCEAEVIRYEYHVLYSNSYQVPVLYFRACFLGKTSLLLDRGKNKNTLGAIDVKATDFVLNWGAE